MKLFSAKKKRSSDAVQTCTTADRGMISLSTMGMDEAETQLYGRMREAVPVIDAAISKIVRLTGSFSIRCRDKRCDEMVEDFCRRVRVGATGAGLPYFVSTYLDELLTYGTAIGEMVMSPYDEGIAALYNAPVSAVELKAGDTPIDVKICVRGAGEAREIKRPELILVSLLNPTPGTLRGNSLLKGLPFVSEILLKIFESIGQNFERAGNVRFAVTYNPPSGASAVNSRQRVEEISREWSRAMRDKSRVCDFVSVGDVNIKAIGADSQVLDCDLPLRHILEQIVAKLSIPPFLLGFSWSSTERMSAQQADILTSELEYYRSLLNPVIEKIIATELESRGYDPRVEVVWSNISLQDETELAQARLDNARAAQIEEQLTEVNE